MVFPVPREATKRSGRLKVDESVTILLPELASNSDLFLSSFLSAELANVYGIPLRVRRTAAIPKGEPFFLMGGASNPLVRQYCEARSIQASSGASRPEGYVLDVTDQAVAIMGTDKPGAFYGLQ